MARHKDKKAPLRAKEKAILQAEKQKARRRRLTKRLALAVLIIGTVAFAAYLIIPAYRYNQAMSLVHAERYNEASQIFGGLTHYRDSDDRLKATSLKALASGKFSNTVYFGRYESDNWLNGREPIKWRMLDANDDGLLLLSDRILDIQPYNRMYDFLSTWETSSLRAWLNDAFLKEAFTEEERDRIILSSLENNDNPRTAIEGGNPTKDKVFVLSLEEIDRYLPEAGLRKAKDTSYANVLGWEYYQGVWWQRDRPFGKELDLIDIRVKYDGLKYFQNKWWLRTPGYFPGHMLSIQKDGIMYDHDLVNLELGVRPAIRVRYGS